MSAPILDEEILNLLIESLGEERAQEIIKDFLGLVEKTIHESLLCLDKKDYDEFAKQCHQIKSNVAYIGGKKLEHLCIKIESFAYHNQYDEIKAMEDEYRAACKDTLAALETIR